MAKKPGFTRDLKVGFRDRGNGRGYFGILKGKRLVAELEWFGVEFAPGQAPEIFPAKENAYLFAASPDLFDACESAIRYIKATTNDAAIVAQLEKARDKALFLEGGESEENSG